VKLQPKQVEELSMKRGSHKPNAQKRATNAFVNSRMNAIRFLLAVGFLTLLLAPPAFGQSEGKGCFSYIDSVGEATFRFVDQMPEPEIGEQELMSRIGKRLTLKSISLDSLDVSDTKTIVRFVVDEQGNLTEKEVLRAC